MVHLACLLLLEDGAASPLGAWAGVKTNWHQHRTVLEFRPMTIFAIQYSKQE
ncbi:hypothetical protein AH4AK4_1952 [Aeromonas hydrophila 4AK4]|nr:hypothetical protein AH4AK4_1952 [Aeromonas hydrophila 4AK4]